MNRTHSTLIGIASPTPHIMTHGFIPNTVKYTDKQNQHITLGRKETEYKGIKNSCRDTQKHIVDQTPSLPQLCTNGAKKYLFEVKPPLTDTAFAGLYNTILTQCRHFIIFPPKLSWWIENSVQCHKFLSYVHKIDTILFIIHGHNCTYGNVGCQHIFCKS